jgi:predicted PurR-regulated permease PerM
MDYFMQIFQKEMTKRLLVLGGLILFFYLMGSLFNLLFLTFIFAYLINNMQNFIVRKIKPYMPIKPSIVTLIIYALIVVLVFFVLFKYVPVIVNQIINIIQEASEIDLSSTTGFFGKYLAPFTSQIELKAYTDKLIPILVGIATNIGKWGFNVFIALTLSLFFILEKQKVRTFIKSFEHSKLSGIYQYLRFFWRNFLRSFGKVIEVQVIIALWNTVLTSIALLIMGFPQLVALGVMVFILSLIPVAGVIISLIPLSLIAFKIGGLIKVVYILALIMIIHAIESYILNPKFMSDKTKLPVFVTFLVLIVSEHLMGIWGLLIGIPLFMFMVDLLELRTAESPIKANASGEKI